MTQYVINIGALPNDGTGDPLRTAFNETNLNFDQVFAAGPVLSNIRIANNTILTTNTNGNLILAPNGVGVVQANVNLVPNTSNIRNLGAADRRWSTLYIQYANISGAITVADLTATGNVTVGGNLSVTGNVINIGNIVTDAKTIQLANTAGTANAANGSGITVGANDAIATMLYSSAANAWTFNIGVDTPNIVVNNISSDDSTFVTIQDGLDVQGDVTAETVSVTGNVTANYFIGNGSQLTGVSNYANANAVAYGQAGWAGNIVPAASNTYSLGNSTLWWSNVWVAGNTMYIGGVPIGMSAGNVLTVNGNAVLQNNSNSTISTTGNITADYFFGNGSQLTGLNTNSISNGTSNVEIPVANGNVTINTNGTYAWTFDDTGNLTLPTNGSIVVDGGDGVIGPISDDLVISWDNEEIRMVSVQGSIEMQADAAFRVQTNYDGANVLYASRWEFSNNELVNISNNFGIVSEAGNLTLSGGRDGVNSGNTIISAVDLGSAVFNWTFGNDGGLYIPNNGALVGVTANNNGYINWVGNSSGDGNGFTTMQLVPDATVDSQVLVLDPTAPGHIHLRAPGIGGNIEQPAANIFLGPEDTNFEITAQYGNAAEARIHSAGNTWTFANDGNLNLPSQGNIVGITANNAGHLQWLGNSSGDGAGYTTLQLIPDDTVTGGDQYVIIDPTAPGHIHIRAGGTQDASSADLFLGGENSYVKIAAGANSDVVVRSNSNNWTFDTLGVLTLPGEGVLRSIGDTVTLQSYNVGTGNANSVYLGTGGGLGFFDQEIGGNWLEIFRSGAEPEIRVPVGRGNLNIQTAQGNTVYNWTFDNTGNFTAPGAISTTGNITAGNFIGTGSNVELVAGSEQWTFDTTGVLTVPGNITGADVVTANTFVSNAFNVVTAGNLSITSQYGLGFTGTILEENGTLELIANGSGGVVAGWDSTYGNGLGNIATVNFNEVGGEGILLRTGNRAATEYNWNFDNTGNLTLPGNTFAVKYANGTAVSLGGNYGDSNVTTLLGNLGSNNISTTGNITAGNLIGNISITGNIQGTSSNVELVAGVYTWTFNNAGNLVLPGNSFAVNYANGTAVSLGGAGTYGDANVTTLLGSFGSNTISTTGTVTTGTLIGTNNLVVNAPSPTAEGGQLTLAWANTSGLTGQGNSTWNLDVDSGSNVRLFYQNASAATGVLLQGNVTANSVSFPGSGGISVTGNATVNGVGTNLIRRASVSGPANTAATLDNFEARLGGSPTRLYINTVSGNTTLTGTSQTCFSGSQATVQWVNVPVGAGAANAFAMSGAVSPSTGGEMVVLNFADQNNGTFMYRVTAIVANTSSGTNMVSIERLV